MDDYLSLHYNHGNIFEISKTKTILIYVSKLKPSNNYEEDNTTIEDINSVLLVKIGNHF